MSILNRVNCGISGQKFVATDATCGYILNFMTCFGAAGGICHFKGRMNIGE
jgi:hypothetical protein